VGYYAGQAITTGSKNVILGSYTGDSGGLDIRTASNYVVLSDGDANIRLTFDDGGAMGLGGANYGTAGQALLSQGAGLPPVYGTPGGGGLTVSTASSSTTLTAAKTLLVCTPTNYGMTVKMADATTCSEGAEQARVQNETGYHIRIANNSGTLLGFVPANSTVSIVCESISTAAGEWSLLGGERVGVSARVTSASIGSMGSFDIGVSVSAVLNDLEIVLVHSASNQLMAAAHRISTGEFGALTVVRAANVSDNTRIMRHSDTAAVVSFYAAANSLWALILTVDPTDLSITVGTQGSFTLPANNRQVLPVFSMLAVPDLPNSFVMSYDTASGNGLVAFSVSGATVTFGASVTLTGTAANVVALATGDKVIACSNTTGSNIYVQPYTVSGNSLTLGTGANTATTDKLPVWFFPLGSKFCLLSTASNTSAVLITLTGTTVTLTEAASVLGAVPLDVIVVNSSKILILTAAATTNANIVRDVSGTATAGTAITANADSLTDRYCVTVDEDDQVIVADSGVDGSTPITSVKVIDCSGNSPVIKTSMAYRKTWTDTFSVSSKGLIVKGVNQVYSPDGKYASVIRSINALDQWQVEGTSLSVRKNTIPISAAAITSRSGSTNSARWLHVTSQGFALCKVECA
jgi:hypothetical protein